MDRKSTGNKLLNLDIVQFKPAKVLTIMSPPQEGMFRIEDCCNSRDILLTVSQISPFQTNHVCKFMQSQFHNVVIFPLFRPPMF